MAVGKSRGSKRSSSSSVASTITTVVFVALCIFGVWMLTSNSIAPPRATARTSSRATSFSNTNGDFSNDLAFSSSNEPEIKDHAAFEDNPGHLPDDAIKSDEPRKSQEDHNLEKEKVKDNEGLESADEEKKKQGRSEAQIFEESTMTQNQQAEQITQKSTDFVGTSNEEESNGNIEEQKIKEGTANLEESDQNQKSSENPIPFDVVHSESQSQKLNEFEKEQRQQRAEDAGDLKGAKEAQNAITDEDQKIQEQQEQQQDQQDQQKQPPITAGVTFSDATKEQQPTEHGFFKEITETEVPLNSLDHKAEQQQPQQRRQGDSRQSKNSLKSGTKLTNSNSGELFPDGGDSGIPKESAESKKSWKTQVTQSANEKERRKGQSNSEGSLNGRVWRHCNSTAGPDYIPCLDNLEALKKVDYKHFRHRERHCPEKPPTCLVPLPEGYKWPIQWPNSRDKIWYHNVPHGKLAEVKGHQNWVKVTGEFLTFPGGGTQFIHGALHYIDFLQESVRNIAWGKHTRVILDVGCGVASFGGYIFQRNVLTMSFAPKDEHEAQVQLALERGIPAISAVMGSQRLQFPSRVFDLIHCARCRVPWHAEGGRLLLELNRVLRPGGYFVWSATPVYQKLKEDVEIWEAMSSLTESMCWELVTITKDELDSVGAAFFRKPVSNECYHKRKQNQPPICKSDDDPNAAWYVPLQSCMHTVPINPAERGSRWPEDWPKRLQTPPYWLNSSHMGIYGKPAPEDFTADYEHWKQVVNEVYMNGLGVSWSNVRNVMDMRAVYGGFAAAMKDLQVWVMNVVNIESPDTLPIIYERGLFGIYHDWCESFSTYPRSYDLLHADHLFSKLKQRCNIVSIVAEVDRIVRPGGKLIVRDESDAINEVQNLLKSLHWEVHLTPSGNKEILSAQKGNWRPETLETSS